MLSPKPVCSKCSRKASGHFLTRPPAAPEVSSILKSRISGSSLGGNVEEMGEFSLTSSRDLDKGEGMLNIRARNR